MESLIIDGIPISLPVELVQNPELLSSEIFTLDVWNNILSDKEKDFLQSFLPKIGGGDGADYRNLWKLFSGDNFHFANPVETIQNAIKKRRRHVRRAHIKHLRRHHRAMVRTAVAFRTKLGANDAEKTKTWREARYRGGPAIATASEGTSALGTASGVKATKKDKKRKQPSGPDEDVSDNGTAVPQNNPNSINSNSSNIKEEDRPPSPPRGPPPEPFLMFSSMRDAFMLNPTRTATFDQLLEHIQEVEPLATHLPPQFTLDQYLSLALVFLTKPPILPTPSPATVNTTTASTVNAKDASSTSTSSNGAKTDGTSATSSPAPVASPAPVEADPSQPLVVHIQDDPSTYQWAWGADASAAFNMPHLLISLEQLFNFGVSRNLVLNDQALDLKLVLSRQQKCVLTIDPSPPDVLQAYHKQENERYQFPYRAYTYRLGGMRYIVAPLVKARTAHTARNHFLLKQERPSNISLLSLVRDAASRLPGGVGSRADVCLLLRDSQYINEDATDRDIQHIVSNVLDRLKSEEDACVRYDGDQKLWVYLHRQRSEKDFSSHWAGTKKTKRANRGSVSATNEEELRNDANAVAASAAPAAPAAPAAIALQQ